MEMLLKWAIVGTGGVAHEFANQFQSDNAVIEAVVSRNQNAADTFANKFHINKAYSDYESALSDSEIDIIYIAIPHNMHYEYIYRALEAHKHVVCEKVIVLNSRQLRVLRELADKNGLYLFEAMTIHFMPVYKDVKEWIKTNDLGPLKMIQVNFGSYKNIEDRYFFKKELAGGALFDIGVYALNFARFFLSEQPNSVITQVVMNKSGVDESSTISLKNEKEELANISLTFRAKMPKVGIIAFENGYFTVDNYPSANNILFTSHSGDSISFESGYSTKRLNYEVKEISQIVLSKTSNPYIDLTSDVLEIMDKVRKEWNLTYDGFETI